MIYCFDLDNTLCKTEGNFYEEAKPILHRIELVNKLYSEGHTIIIDTARGCVSGKNWFYYTVTQLKSWNVNFHTLRTGQKIGADIFIDDRAINDRDFFKD
jgi:hypothetical protein